MLLPLLAPAALLSLHLPAPATGTASVDELPDPATWTQWRGNRRDGHVGGPTWPEALDEESLTAAWTAADLGDSYATPIVSRTHVFTIGTEGKKEEVVRAFDRATGAQVWETRWEGAMKVPFFAAKNGSWVRSTPAFDGEALYVGGMRDLVVCLDAEDGAVRWRADFPARHGTNLPPFGLVCSPLIVGDALYVQAGEALARLDRRTGETVWLSEAAGNDGRDSAFSSPILATIAGRPQLVVQSRTELGGIDPETGDELWSTPVQAFRGMNILTPQMRGDAVFTSAYGGKSHLFEVTAGEQGHEVREAWSARAEGYMTSPVVVEEHAYLYLRRKRFTCIGLGDGSEGWLGAPTGDEYWSLAAQGDRILALSEAGVLRLVRANPEEYELLGEVQAVDGPSWAHVAVTAPVEGDAGADVFIRSQTGLHAFRWR